MKSLFEELATIVHSSLVGGHRLGAYYNIRRSKKVDSWTLFHLFTATGSAIAVYHHVHNLNKL